METVRRSINTRHLFWKVIERWKLILIAAIIGAVAGAGYAIWKQKVENNQRLNPNIVTTEISVTEEELANVYSMASLYDSIQAQKDYSKQSIWMKCQNLTRGLAKATYCIQAKTDLEENQIATLYTDILENNEIYNGIALQEEMHVEYVREGIVYSIPSNSMLRLEVTSYSKEKAQEWLEEIEEVLISQKEELEKEIGTEFTIKEVYKNNTEVFDIGLADRQRTCMTNITTAQTNYDNLVAVMPVNQREYLTFYLQARNDENYIAGQSFQKETAEGTQIAEEVLMTEEERKEFYQKRLKIDMALGFVFGSFAVCLFFILRYAYSPVLVNSEELSMMYDLSVLGGTKIPIKNKQKKNNFNIVQEEEEEYKKIIARIGVQNIKGEKIYIAGTQIKESCMKLLEQEGKKQGISIVLGKNFIKESEAMIELRDCDAVVFMEKEGASKYIEIEEEVKICKESNKKIIGVVMV